MFCVCSRCQWPLDLRHHIVARRPARSPSLARSRSVAAALEQRQQRSQLVRSLCLSIRTHDQIPWHPNKIINLFFSLLPCEPEVPPVIGCS
jgi:hypothetical protein